MGSYLAENWVAHGQCFRGLRQREKLGLYCPVYICTDDQSFWLMQSQTKSTHTVRVLVIAGMAKCFIEGNRGGSFFPHRRAWYSRFGTGYTHDRAVDGEGEG